MYIFMLTCGKGYMVSLLSGLFWFAAFNLDQSCLDLGRVRAIDKYALAHCSGVGGREGREAAAAAAEAATLVYN
jgi:hypothetical protein